ncbi:unnamed protein product, partial [Rotaria sp. Silwood1]
MRYSHNTKCCNLYAALDRGCPNFVLQVGWDYYGNDIPPFPVPVPDYAGCCSQCEATIGCNAFAYSPSSRDCWLKT